MNRTIRSLLALLAVVGLVFALAGCAQPTPEPTEPPAEEEAEAPAEEEEEAPAEEMEEEVFKLGVIGPFSGPNARTGDEFRGAVEIAMEDIGYQIGKYNIELVWIDSQSDPAKATEAYEEAIVQKGIQAGILNWHSSVAVACMEVAAKHQIPHFFGLGAADTVNITWEADPDTYHYWAAKGWPEPAKLTGLYVGVLEDAIARGIWEPEVKTAALWGEETDWGRSLVAGMKQQFTENGWEIVSEDYFPLDQTEFTPLLTKLKGMEPTVFAGTGSAPPLYSSLIKQADEVGLESMIVADGLGWVGEWYDLTGESSNYVIDQIPGWATDEAETYAARFEETYNLAPSTSAAGLCYDYANMFIAIANQVYEDTGELTTEGLADFAKNQLQTGEWTYTDGIIMEEYAYTPETAPDPVVGEGKFIFPVLQYFDGEGKVIFPPQWAEQDMQPKP
jgi:branched-chain amino acid transport system substrate-binding protein